MISDEMLSGDQEQLNQLLDRLLGEVEFSQNFIEQSNNPQIEKEWMGAVRTACGHGVVLIRGFQNSLDEFRLMLDENYRYSIGKIAIQPFLDIVNSFETFLDRALELDSDLSNTVEGRISSRLALLEKNWGLNRTGKSKRLYRELQQYFERKRWETAFIRDSFLKAGVFDKTDYELLRFAWDIRNSMHRNFTAIKDIKFKYPDIKTGKVYEFDFEEGEPLYHPESLVSFYLILEQLIFIMLKVLQSGMSDEKSLND